MKICPKCAAENADTAKFCNECGAPLKITETESIKPKEEVNPLTVTEAVTDKQGLKDSQSENLQENTEAQNSYPGKVCSMIVIASDGTTGIAEALNFASVFDKSIDLDDRSKMADLILYKVYNTDNTVIVMDNNTVEDGYLFYIMTKEYFDNNFKQ